MTIDAIALGQGYDRQFEVERKRVKEESNADSDIVTRLYERFSIDYMPQVQSREDEFREGSFVVLPGKDHEKIKIKFKGPLSFLHRTYTIDAVVPGVDNIVFATADNGSTIALEMPRERFVDIYANDKAFSNGVHSKGFKAKYLKL